MLTGCSVSYLIVLVCMVCYSHTVEDHCDNVDMLQDDFTRLSCSPRPGIRILGLVLLHPDPNDLHIHGRLLWPVLRISTSRSRHRKKPRRCWVSTFWRAE